MVDRRADRRNLADTPWTPSTTSGNAVKVRFFHVRATGDQCHEPVTPV